MIDAVSGRKKSNLFYWFGIGNLSNFAMVKNLRKFGGCLVDKNTFFFWKQVSVCWLGTIHVLLVVTGKMFCMYLFVITVIFSILNKLKN